MIILDLDGVLVNHHYGILRTFPGLRKQYDAFERPVPWNWASRILDDDIWKKLPSTWWEALPWTPEGRRILDLCEEKFGTDICLATSPSESPAAAYGKMLWIEQYLPEYLGRCQIGRSKHLLGQPGRILIDDSEDNIEKFCSRGGTGILVPRPWNRNHQLDTLDHVFNELRKL
jgi:hypothetical protein